MGGPRLTAVGVVVPAHDEEAFVGACLTSVRHAVDVLRSEAPGIAVEVLVVLDRCTDRTAEVVAAQGVTAWPVDAGSVGAARRAGVARVAELLSGHPADGVLVVNTDADCTVPGPWLVDHLALAADHDLVQGWVRPDPADLSAPALSAWLSDNPVDRGSLHGANLGVRLAAYLEAGGFPEVDEHEDLLLVRALKACGARAVSGTTVLTSGRREGRVPGGFAGYLRTLDEGLDHGLDRP